MLVHVEIVSGPNAGLRLEVKPGDVIELGRGRQIGPAILRDEYLSARHLRLWRDAENCRLQDLGSTNGTFVNGSRVSDAILRSGDRIDAGASRFVIRIGRDVADSQDQGVSPELPGSTPAPARTVAPRVTAPDPAGATVGDSTHPPGREVALFTITNTAPFSVATLRWSDRENRPALSVVVKATFRIASPDPAGTTLPVFREDICRKDQPASVIFESDLVPFKPRADVVLVGRAYAPDGRPVAQLMAGLRVGNLRYGVAVFGDRTWQWLPIAPTISTPEPFTSMDLVYDRAFGGIDGPGGTYCKENLAGTGFIGKNTRERVSGLRLPNIEDPRSLITGWQTHPRPAGLGFYGRGWAPRLAYAGTYDEKYMKERHPLPPRDFSYRFFNGAHPDLQVEGYLHGDEEVVLVNVCPNDPEVRFRLPGIAPTITVARWTVPPEQWIEEHRGPGGGLPDALPLAEESVTPVLDTLVFVPDQGIFYEVFRGVCRLSSLDSLEVARITIGL